MLAEPIKSLIQKIKEKKEFSSLDDAFVQSQVELFLKRNPKLAAPFKIISSAIDINKL